MKPLNYFEFLCFFWAGIGLGSRLLMGLFGSKWKDWEINQTYAAKRPGWIYGIVIIGILLVGFTWYQVVATSIPYSWIIAALITITLVKISALLFAYDRFRQFVSNTLSNRKKFRQLNLGVILFFLVFIFSPHFFIATCSIP